MGRGREKMKTCEYLCYLQSKHTHFFPCSVRLSPERFSLEQGRRVFAVSCPDHLCDGRNNLISHVRKPRFVFAKVPFYTFHSPFCQRRGPENSCVCPNYFITPTHEQTVYFWKLTPCSVNSSLTSGMGTDNLPERPEGKTAQSPSSSLCLRCTFLSSSCLQLLVCVFVFGQTAKNTALGSGS